MDQLDFGQRIGQTKELLQVIKKITSLVTVGDFEDGSFSWNTSMFTVYPRETEELQKTWDSLQKAVPPGFVFGADFRRHMSFNQAKDWFDISNSDIDNEIKCLEDYVKNLYMVKTLCSLHPELARVERLIIEKDFDAALKIVFTSLEIEIRTQLKLKVEESTMPAIGKAFSDGKLKAPMGENNDAARNFLQGVLGYYRNHISHKKLKDLSTESNSLSSVLYLFYIAYSGFKLFDACVKYAEQSSKDKLC